MLTSGNPNWHGHTHTHTHSNPLRTIVQIKCNRLVGVFTPAPPLRVAIQLRTCHSEAPRPKRARAARARPYPLQNAKLNLLHISKAPFSLPLSCEYGRTHAAGLFHCIGFIWIFVRVFSNPETRFYTVSISIRKYGPQGSRLGKLDNLFVDPICASPQLPLLPQRALTQ